MGRRPARRVLYAALFAVLSHSSAFAQKAATLPAVEVPIEVTAKELQYFREEDRYVADGEVRLTQGLFLLTADHVDLDNRSGQVRASGRVAVRDGDDELTANRMEFNLRTREGLAETSRMFIKKDHYYLDAGRMNKTGADHYELQDWSLTACETEDGGEPLWRLRGSRARADLGQYLVARGVVFSIKDVPVFYAPYLILPIKTERQSGLLIPRVGYSSRDGLRFNESFFWAISPSQDATLSLDYRGLRGVGGELEYRYKLSRGSGGELRFNLFDDREIQSLRTEIEYRHTQRFSEDFQARLDTHLVNDNSRLRDLSDTTEDRTRQSLVSNFLLFRRWDRQELYLMAQWTRDLLATTRTTLQRLPQAGYALREVRLGRWPVYAGLDATAVNFWREEEDEAAGLIRAVRLDAFPRLWTTLRAGAVTLRPGLGYRETWYSRDLASDSPANRGLGVLNFSAAAPLSRRFGPPSGRGLLHAIEPSAQYEYVPFRDQSRLPHFDEVDQLPRKNHLTYALTNRFAVRDGTDPEGPVHREWLYWKLSQAYDLHERRTRDDPGPSRPFSNIRSEAVLRPSGKSALDLDVFYNPYRKETVAFNSHLRFQAGRIGSVSAGQRYTREDAVTPRGDVFNPASPEDRVFWYSQSGPLIRYLTGAAGIAVGEHLRLAARAYYDLAARDFAELDYGLEYAGQCWGFTVTYQDLPDRNQVSFMVTLRPTELTGDKSVLRTIGPGG